MGPELVGLKANEWTYKRGIYARHARRNIHRARPAAECCMCVGGAISHHQSLVLILVLILASWNVATSGARPSLRGSCSNRCQPTAPCTAHPRTAPCRVATASAARSGAGGRQWALQSLGLVQLLGLPCRDCRSTPMSRSPPRRSAEFPWRTRTRSSSSAPRATWRRRRPVRGPVALPMLVSAVDCLLLLCACTDCVVTLC
jgi:hypothetical protein